MSLYKMIGSGNPTLEAAALRVRLASWHDAMVAHERKIRAGTEESCADECPHAEARTLWIEAVQVFGDHARELTFLRSRATAASDASEELVVPADLVSEAADSGHRSMSAGREALDRQSHRFSGGQSAAGR